jgi:hypothetical protein
MALLWEETCSNLLHLHSRHNNPQAQNQKKHELQPEIDRTDLTLDLLDIADKYPGR